MCEPEFYTVAYEINPYMHLEVRPDPDAARTEWEALVSALLEAGASVERLPPSEGQPDLVFTANAGYVQGRRFVPSRFRHPERQGETPHYLAWFQAHGFSVEHLPGGEAFEGAGDALPFGQPLVVLAGYRQRSSIAAHAALGRVLGVPVRSVELVDERYYHIDLVFCPLDERRALVAGQGLDSYGRRVVEALVPEPIWLDDDEAASFCANSVVVGSVVVMPACTPRLGRLLEAAGYEVAVAPVGEFIKAGGGCRCLTLALDVPEPG
jgi:N-dimethylarginine dimethylaminohydrolase